jgi:hypothetical protein
MRFWRGRRDWETGRVEAATFAGNWWIPHYSTNFPIFEGVSGEKRLGVGNGVSKMSGNVRKCPDFRAFFL